MALETDPYMSNILIEIENMWILKSNLLILLICQIFIPFPDK